MSELLVPVFKFVILERPIIHIGTSLNGDWFEALLAVICRVGEVGPGLLLWFCPYRLSNLNSWFGTPTSIVSTFSKFPCQATKVPFLS